MRASLLVMTAGLAACASVGTAMPRTMAPPETALDRAVSAAAQPGLATTRIGTSSEGRPIHVIRVGTGDNVDERPAVAVIAGVNPMHRVGTDVAMGVATRLLADHGDLLSRATVYVIPRVNTDTVEWLDANAVKQEFTRTVTPQDADHDGRVDEDGPKDLNGDGMITMMRIANPAPGLGVEATHVIDTAEPRVMREPDRSKGERATHALLVEGLDQDGDGLFSEDGPGGTDMDMNFPARWPEYASGAGPFQLCEPEARAVAEWVLSRPNVVAVVVYGPHDTIVTVPQAGRFDDSGRIPTGIENEDKAAYDEMSRIFKEATGITSSPTVDGAGSLHAWTYAHMGLLTFSTPVWVRPDLVQAKEAAKPAEPAPAPAPEPAGGEAGGASAPGDAEMQARMNEFLSATPERRRQMMAEFDRLPPEVRQQMMSRAGFGAGQPGAGQPGAGQPGGGQPGGPPPGGGGRRGGRGGAGGGGAPAQAAPASSPDDAKWVKYSDEKREGKGFVPWTSFQHPQLGTVEIGGMAPGFRFNPPGEEIAALVGQQTDFVAKLLDKLPKLSIEGPSVARMGQTVWRVNVRVVNEGGLATRSAIGVKARRLPGTIMRVGLPEERVVSGSRIWTIPALAPTGGSQSMEWVLIGEEGETVELTLTSPELGRQTISVNLKEAQR